MTNAVDNLIRTTIVTTLGPASADEGVIRRLIGAGTDVFRLNFSHGSLDVHAEMLRRVRAVARELGAAVAVLGDLCGPKVRLGDIEPAGGIVLTPGDRLVIQRDAATGREGRVSTNYERFIDEVEIRQRVLIDDGSVRLVVTDKGRDEVACRCEVGGVVTSHKGVNLPDTSLSVAAITDYDRKCVEWAVAHDVDYLALSFVRRAEELHGLRALLLERRCDAHLVAKVEKREAVENIGPIIQAADAVMVARGDLGVEMDATRVPVVQKDLIRRCREAGKPVIVATQMLQSMIASPSPTRAEVSDVANAIYDGTDAVMLSGETSVGQYPVGAVEMMNRIAATTEGALGEGEVAGALPAVVHDIRDAQEAALARGACEMVRALHFKLIVAWSPGGVLARFFSKLRPRVAVVAIDGDERSLRRMALYYGVRPVLMEGEAEVGAMLRKVDRELVERGLVEVGDPILGVGAIGPGRGNGIVTRRVGEAE